MREKAIYRVSILSILANLALAVFKLIAGIFGRSMAMISDAVHSASDVLSTVIVIIGVRIGSREEDDNHPYGHERFESAMSIVLATLLVVVGLGIGRAGIGQLNDPAHLAVPSLLAVIAAFVSIGVKEAMFWITWSVGKKYDSGLLRADAWHHRSDSLSSVGSAIGIIGARNGILWLDVAASIVICLFILKVAVDIFRDAFEKMVDTACPGEYETELQAVISSVDGVEGVSLLKTRLFADRIYVEVEIEVDGRLSVAEGHAIAEHVHDRIEEKDEKIKHCCVHVNPC